MMFAQLAFWKTYFTPDRFSIDQMPDLTGKVAIVTGANSGLGYYAMVGLAAHGAHVFLACRSQKRAQQAIEKARAEIKTKYPNAPAAPQLEFLELDLGDMNKTHQAAQEFLKKGLPLHILINNAGLIIVPYEQTIDGIENQFGVNHVGPFVFTMALLDRLKESQPSRIVCTSSYSHEILVSKAGIEFEKLKDEIDTIDKTPEGDLGRYGQSKLANILFAKALSRRLAKDQVFVNVTHPGVCPKSVVPEDDSWKELITSWVKKAFALPYEVGALTQLYLATSTEIEEKDIRGRYFIPVANEILPSSHARDEKLQEKLWAWTEEVVSEKVKA
ncbi:hypothetical protein BGX23_004677 [Mortierella sp. AD031]|nr:hypothetical protein BGX23_004677 [Mortierella sp. AD031]KAG0217310.1 hypothetical protein BGX33_010956 [Mortierella sp. NVP41]